MKKKIVSLLLVLSMIIGLQRPYNEIKVSADEISDNYSISLSQESTDESGQNDNESGEEYELATADAPVINTISEDTIEEVGEDILVSAEFIIEDYDVTHVSFLNKLANGEFLTEEDYLGSILKLKYQSGREEEYSYSLRDNQDTSKEEYTFVNSKTGDYGFGKELIYQFSELPVIGGTDICYFLSKNYSYDSSTGSYYLLMVVIQYDVDTDPSLPYKYKKNALYINIPVTITNETKVKSINFQQPDYSFGLVHERKDGIFSDEYNHVIYDFFDVMDGGVLTVTLSDESTEEYIVKNSSLYLDDDTEMPYNYIIEDDQIDNVWISSKDDCHYSIFIAGLECTVPVTVIPENQYSISFVSNEGWIEGQPMKIYKTYTVDIGKSIDRYVDCFNRFQYELEGYKIYGDESDHIYLESEIKDYIPDNDIVFIAQWKSKESETENIDEYDYRLEIEDEFIDDRNDELYGNYGISYEDLFNIYPDSLDADIKPLSIITQTGSEAANQLSSWDMKFAAIMEAVGDNTFGLKYIYRDAFGRLIDGVASPYEKQLDDLTILYVNEIFNNKTVLSNAIGKVEGIYSNYRATHRLKDVKEAFENDKFEFLIDVYYKNVTPPSELREIKRAMMDKEDYIMISLHDKISMAEYYIFLLEAYHTNYEIIKKLKDMVSADSVLGEGLQRYLDNYGTLFLPKFLDEITSDVFIDEFCGGLINCSFEWNYLGGAWSVVHLFIDVIEWIYEHHLPSVTDITRYFLLDAFLSDIDIGLLTHRQKMMSELSENGVVSRESINDYEFLYNTKIETIKMYLSAAKDITKSSFFGLSETNLQTRISILENSVKRNYDYDYYIELCIKKAAGETIDENDFIIYGAPCKVSSKEKIDLYRENGKLICKYTNSNNQTEELDVFQDKVFGGIELVGGEINILADANTSNLLISYGTVNTNGNQIVADKLDFSNGGWSNMTVNLTGGGSFKSNKDITIQQIKINGNGETIESENTIILSDHKKSGGGVEICNCTIGGKKGVNCGGPYLDFWNSFNNVVVKGDIIGGYLVAKNSLKVEGKIKCDLKALENSNIEAESMDMGEIHNYGGTIICNGNYSFSDGMTSENEKSKWIVYGNIYANGFTGGWGSLGDYSYNLKAGTLDLYGNLYGINDDVTHNGLGPLIYYSFAARGKFNVNLCGNSKQIIVLPDNSGVISNLYINNPNIEIRSDLSIENLYGNLNLENINYDLEVKNAHENTITVGNVLNGNVKISNGSYCQTGSTHGAIELKNSDGDISGDVLKGISVDTGDCDIRGNIKGTVNLVSASLKQQKDKTIEADEIKIVNSTLSSGGDVSFEKGLTLSANSLLDVDGDFYVNGFTYTNAWNDDRYTIKGGRIDIQGNLYISHNQDKPNDELFYMKGDSILSFKEGNHYICSDNKYYINKLEQVDNSVLYFNDENCNVESLSSDIVMDSSKIKINKWNGFSVVNSNSKNITIDSPDDYIRFYREDDNGYIDIYKKCGLEDGVLKKIDNNTEIDIYMGMSYNLEMDCDYSIQLIEDNDKILHVGNGKTITPIGLGSSSIVIELNDNNAKTVCNINVLSGSSYCRIFGHKYDEGILIKDATCVETGDVKYTCEVCGKTYNKSIPQLAHNICKLDEKAPTCIEDGYTEGYICSKCGYISTGRDLIPKLNHEYKEVIGTHIDPTCIQNGKEADRKCVRCGELFEGAQISAFGHDEVLDEMIPATYKSTGLTEGSHCSVCKEVIKAQQVIPYLEGFDKDTDGKTYYYKDGKKQLDFTGFVKNVSGVWFVEKGVLNTAHEDIVKNPADGNWYYISGGKQNLTFTGFAVNKNGTFYCQKGLVCFITSIVKNPVDGNWYCINNGKQNLNYTGFATNNNGTYYCKNGIVQFITSIEKNPKDGKWYYINNGKQDLKFIGFATNSNGTYYCKNGIVQFITSIEKNPRDGKWYYINNGKLDLKFTGYATNRNGTYYCRNGVVQFITSIEKNPKDGKWYYINNGKQDMTFTGIAKNSNGLFLIQKGIVNFNYSGKYTYNGKTYTIKNGKVI